MKGKQMGFVARLKKGLSIVSAISLASAYGACSVVSRPKPDPINQNYGDRIFYGGGTSGKSDAGSLSPANFRFTPPPKPLAPRGDGVNKITPRSIDRLIEKSSPE